MGGSPSTPSPPPPPPPSPTFRDPWRKISWGDKERDLQYVRNYQPENTNVKHLRILLYGPVAAGKSSFINSVVSTVRGRLCVPAEAYSATVSNTSHSKKYDTHRIQKESRGNFYPFVFNDIMGLEERAECGVRVEDIKLALKGHVKEGYKFNPASPLSDGDPGYNSKPSADDKVHLLVCVCDANAPEIKGPVMQKMRIIREAASDLGIPQVAIVTKVDQACGETQKDLKNVYKSKHLKKKITDFSARLGFPLNCIFAVKNYSSETYLDEDVDTLILNALRLMIDFGSTNSIYSSPPYSTFSVPWRKISWGDKERDLQYVRNYQPENTDVKHLRILPYGPVGVGKSSFISSVVSTVRGRMSVTAEASATVSDTSHSKKYKTHRIQKESRGNFYPFVLNDIMGLEERAGCGVRVEDIKLALKGHLKEGYEFNPASPLSDCDPGYISSPSADDKVHLLVCVCSANAAEITEPVMQKMREIREVASGLGIPQVAIVTKVDEACGETQKDLKNVYKSEYLKKKITDFSARLGIPLNCIFAVKNYSSETSLDEDVDTLILKALRLMIDFGDDFINKM